MNALLIKAENHITQLLTNQLPNGFYYHNLRHTQGVINHTKTLIEAEGIEAEDVENLLIAAWFHDVGYINTYDKHEEASVKLFVEFSEENNIPKAQDIAISQLILATKANYKPKTILEQIIKDADCAHLGSKNAHDVSDLLRQEWEEKNIKTFTDFDWITENIAFFNTHAYYTNYAKKNWQATKDKNLATLFKRQRKLKQEQDKTQLKLEEFKLKKQKAKLPERGIETMFRVTLRNHITLSDIADTKANILLSVNAIIVSLVLSNLIPKLDNPSNGYLIYPTIIFVLFTIAAMVLSVLATRPNVTSGEFTKEDVNNKKVNLLFFGNFHKMKLQDFEWAMNQMMQDKNYLYSSMTKDLYFLGKVLDKKYKILRITYTIFIVGIILSVIAFGIAFKSQSA